MNRKFMYGFWSAIAFSLCFCTAACSDDDDFTDDGDNGNQIQVIPDSDPAAPVEPSGFYVVNEDWLGHSNGTVNHFKVDGDSYGVSYRIYRAANEDEELGVTSQFATIWGDNAYIVSKQGNRLVVADAETMQRKAVFTELGGDGRAFLGVTDTKGYVSLNGGIVTFDIANLQLGALIEGVSGQIGNMCLAGGKVFAVSQSNGLYVIDPETDTLSETIEGTYYTLTVSRDGNVWVASADGLVRIDPKTMERETVAYAADAAIASSWGAWNAGSLCASTRQNVIYWAAGGSMFGGARTVFKYDIETGSMSSIYELRLSDYGTQLAFYGAGLRVDPYSDELILTVKHNGWGNAGAYNWIYKLDADGGEITHFEVLGDDGSAASWGGNAEDWNGKYFWFPAMPFFEDANKPQILLNQIMLTPGETKKIDLSEKIVDYDNTYASMRVEATFADNGLLREAAVADGVLTVTAGSVAGNETCTVSVVSNGVRVEKEIAVNVVEQ